MVQGFYSLDEAARVLGMAQEELSQMAQRREIRAFADRGTWRFRTQDVEELARRLGKGSSPDLQLGESNHPKPHDSPAPKSADPDDSSVFTFALGRDDEEVPLGLDTPSSKNLGRGPRSPKPGSDSDVRLVSEGSDVDFRVSAGDSGSSITGRRKPSSDSSVKLTESKSDSDVKIVPDATAEDSSLPIGIQPPRKGSDSDIRLEQQIPSAGGKGRSSHSGDESLLTEEIDLDEEIRAAEAATKKARGKTKPQSPAPKKGPASPFELSDSDLEEPKSKPKKKAPTPESSSELEFAPGADSSPISLSSDEMPAMPTSSSDDVVDLGAPSSKKAVRGGPDSGINLDAPADSGISLEQSGDGSDELEFEISLDSSSTPKPAPAAREDDSSSEFELTLDDSGGLAPLDEEGLAPSDSGEKDIFETDFEVPALEDESGSQAVALDGSDTDLESSDFDLALGDEDSGTDEESGSQVVVLDEDEADEGAATVARPPRKGGRAAPVADLDSDSDEDVGVLSEEEEPLAEEEEELPRRAAAASADWGLIPALVMGPCAVVMLLVGIMGFELLHSMWGYRQPGRVSGPIVRNLSELFGAELPKD